MIELIGAGKQFGGQEVFSGANIKVGSGETVAIMGKSGAGKTTLLRCIAGLDYFSSGKAVVKGKVGLVFQQYNLWPHLNVLGNITLPLVKVKGLTKSKAEEKAYRILEELGLKELSSRSVDTLSGGQQQRIAIARTLAMDPEILALDEVTSSLDKKTTMEIVKIIKRMQKYGSTILVATHNKSFAKKIAHRTLIIENGGIKEASQKKNE